MHQRGGSTKSIDTVQTAVRYFTAYAGKQWLSDGQALLHRQIVRELRLTDLIPVKTKLPLTLSRIHAALANLDLRNPGALRIAACILLGHDALLRSSELLQLQVKDISWQSDLKRLSLRIFRTKTHRSGPPEHIVVFDHDGLSGYKLLVHWFHLQNPRLSASPDNYVFGYLKPEGVNAFSLSFSKPPSRRWLADEIKRLVSAINLDPSDFSTHSLRAGGATDLQGANVSVETVRKVGRWKSDEVFKYFRDPDGPSLACADAFSKIARAIKRRRGKEQEAAAMGVLW